MMYAIIEKTLSMLNKKNMYVCDNKSGWIGITSEFEKAIKFSTLEEANSFVNQIGLSKKAFKIERVEE